MISGLFGSPRSRTARRLSELCFSFPPSFSFLLPSASNAARLLSPPRRLVRRLAPLRLAARRGPTAGRPCASGRGPAAERKPRWPPPPPCTPRSPRRRCCPAWPWTATAWARPRPDACPLQACPARCRPESTWPASTCTRTRVSALRSARPLLSPRDPAGEAGPGETTRSVPPSPSSHWGFGPSFSPDRYTGCPRGTVRPRGSLRGGQRPVWKP